MQNENLHLVAFEELLSKIAKKPGLYVASPSLRAVAHYLDGYCMALRDGGDCEAPLDGWQQWIELEFGISHPAWHWTRILLHQFGTDQAAIATLPDLFSRFTAERNQNGLQTVLEQWEKQFGGIAGIREPESTATNPFA